MPPLTPPTRCADRTSGRCRGCGRVVTGRDGAPGSPPWPSESPGSSPRRLRVLPLHLSEAAAAAARAGQRLGPAGPESGGWRAPVRRDRQYADARSGARGAVRDSGAPAGGTAPSGAGAIPQAAGPARRWPRLPEWTSKTGARDLPLANKTSIRGRVRRRWRPAACVGLGRCFRFEGAHTLSSNENRRANGHGSARRIKHWLEQGHAA